MKCITLLCWLGVMIFMQVSVYSWGCEPLHDCWAPPKFIWA